MLQPCSSSPRRARSGSADRVVFPRSGKTEKKGAITVGAFVGAAVERQYPEIGKVVIHNGENQFLYRTHVRGPEDNTSSAVEIHGNCHVRGAAVGHGSEPALIPCAVELFVRQCQEKKWIIVKSTAFDVPGDFAEHVVDEKTAQGVIGNGENGQGVGCVGSHDPVQGIDPFLRSEDGQGVFRQHIEGIGVEGNVIG